MELTLNLAWILLATLMVWLWVRYAPRDGASRRMQFVALALILLILLPAISVTDDLMAAQNLAETDSCQRKDHVGADAHSAQHVIQFSLLSVFAMLCSGSVSVAVPDNLPISSAKIPAVARIQSRPPPAA